MKKVSWVFAFAVAVVALCNAGLVRAELVEIHPSGVAVGSGETTRSELLEMYVGGQMVDNPNYGLPGHESEPALVPDLGIGPALALARNGGTWDGTDGLTYSWLGANGGEAMKGVTVACYNNWDSAYEGTIYSTFGTEDLAGGTYGARGYLLVKPVWIGDVNFDGSVDLTDIRIMSQKIGNTYSGAGMANAWMAGDVNFDGVVDLTDMRLWSQKLGNTGDAGGVITHVSIDTPSSITPPPAGSLAGGVTPTPEPGTLVLLVAGLAAVGVVVLRKKK